MPNAIDFIEQSTVKVEEKDVKFFKALAWLTFIVFMLWILI